MNATSSVGTAPSELTSTLDPCRNSVFKVEPTARITTSAGNFLPSDRTQSETRPLEPSSLLQHHCSVKLELCLQPFKKISNFVGDKWDGKYSLDDTKRTKFKKSLLGLHVLWITLYYFKNVLI